MGVKARAAQHGHGRYIRESYEMEPEVLVTENWIGNIEVEAYLRLQDKTRDGLWETVSGDARRVWMR